MPFAPPYHIVHSHSPLLICWARKRQPIGSDGHRHIIYFFGMVARDFSFNGSAFSFEERRIMVHYDMFSGDSPNTPCRLLFACPNQPWGSPSAITRESEARVMVRKLPPPSNCNICSLSFWQTLWLFILLFFTTTCLLFLHDKDPSRRGGKGTKSLPLPPPWVWETHPPTSLSPGEMYEWETKTQWRFALSEGVCKSCYFYPGRTLSLEARLGRCALAYPCCIGLTPFWSRQHICFVVYTHACFWWVYAWLCYVCWSWVGLVWCDGVSLKSTFIHKHYTQHTVT